LQRLHEDVRAGVSNGEVPAKATVAPAQRVSRVRTHQQLRRVLVPHVDLELESHPCSAATSTSACRRRPRRTLQPELGTGQGEGRVKAQPEPTRFDTERV
jgi:hypothetical protein